MNFAPWWQDEFLRDKISALGWTLVASPVWLTLLVFVFFPARVDELAPPVAIPLYLAMVALGVGLVTLERRLRPRHHHAQVLYVDMPGVRPYHYSICECRWFGGVSDDAESAFADARKHTSDVDEDVVVIDK